MVEASSHDEPTIVGVGQDSLREAFGHALVDLATDYPRLVVLDGDVAAGTGTHHFRSKFSDRFFQFGIAEQNMIAAAGGFAAAGLLPVAATFAVFILRAYEQVRLSIAYPRRNVKLVASHPGLDVGPDGASAQALEDLAAMRAIPGMVVVSPADAREVTLATKAILQHDGPVYMRTGRSPARHLFGDDHIFELGKGQIIRQGEDATVIACGVCVARALDAAAELAQEGLSVRVVNMPTIKPIDSELIAQCAEETGCFVTAEDHNVLGGLGSAVAEVLVRTRPVPLEFVGVQDVFGESGDVEDLPRKYGIDAPSIGNAVRTSVERKK